MPKGQGRLKLDSSPALIQYHIKVSPFKSQTAIANHLNVTRGAVSLAINDNPHMKLLKQKIVNLLNKDNKSLIQICHTRGKKINKEKFN